MEAAFWGLTCDPEVGYSQLVDQTFRLSNVALDPKTKAKSGRVTLSVQAGNNVFVIANLLIGAVEQQTVDLTFSEGEEITFMVEGDATLHLTGNYLFDNVDDDEDEEEGDEDDGEDEEEDNEDDEVEEDDDDDEEGQDIYFNDDGEPVDSDGNPIDLSSLIADFDGDEDDDDEDDEVEEVEAANGKRKPGKLSANDKKKPKIYEIEENEDEDEGDEDEGDDEDAEDEDEEETEAPQKQATKKAPKANEPKKEQPKKGNDEKSASKKKTLPNGLTIEDVVEGKGPIAKNGKKVSVRYIGKLANGKTFDSNSSGKPFSFKLGAGQVIKGWDLGVQGMHVGGTRKLVIPAALAYGSRGAPPDIPGGATLHFEVKLLGVN